MDYRLFIIPLLAMIINEIIKTLINVFKGNFGWPSIFSYGGMPSSHTAMVTALCTVLGYYEGLNSPTFALALILALLTIKDASGIRWQLGNQGTVINQLIKELPDDKEYHFPVLNERFGHKNTEIFFGILVGLCVSLLFISLF